MTISPLILISPLVTIHCLQIALKLTKGLFIWTVEIHEYVFALLTQYAEMTAIVVVAKNTF